MAVECHQKTQQEGATSGYDLYMDITGSIHRQYILFLDWFYPACRTDHHLVDDAAYLYPEHHLYQRLAGGICRAQEFKAQTYYRQVVLPLY